MTKKILVADDDEPVLFEAKKILEAYCYSVATVPSAEAALEYLGNAGQGCDLLLTDLCMKKMNGLDLVQQVHRDPRYKNLPAILMTKNLCDRDVAEAKTAGCVDVVCKNWEPPLFDSQDLLAKVKKYCPE